jgi:hypothetical protein
MIDGAQTHLRWQDSLMNEPPMPSYKCVVTGEPIYKGVRIDGEEHFSIDVYQSYAWVEWYKVNAGLTDREIYDLKVEHFTDNGFRNTLK